MVLKNLSYFQKFELSEDLLTSNFFFKMLNLVIKSALIRRNFVMIKKFCTFSSWERRKMLLL